MEQVGFGVAMLTLVVAAIPLLQHRRRRRHDRSLELFHQCRRVLRDQYRAVTEAALDANRSYQFRDLPVLAPAAWVLPRPIPLDQVAIQLVPPAEAMRRMHWKPPPGLWPDSKDGKPIHQYSQAIEAFDKPELFFEGVGYRLEGVDERNEGHFLRFSEGSFFQSVDTLHLLGFLASRAFRAGRGVDRVYTRVYGGPFDLRNRCAVAAIITLTIVKNGDGPRFLMHWRDPALVASAGNMYHVTPAGEFESSDLGPRDLRTDFSIWHNIMREYAEEFAGYTDYIEAQGTRIPYDTVSPFVELNAAVTNDQLRVHYLGTVLDPLNWKPEILTVTVFDEDVFRATFPNPERDPEGKKLGSQSGGFFEGSPFDEESINEFRESGKLTPVSDALLTLAWQHRQTLGV